MFLNNSGGGVGEFMDPPGSGVSGDWVFNTSERFNDYRAHEFDVDTQEWTGGNWSFMKYDHVEGYGNKSVYENSEQPPSYDYTPMGYNHIEGSYNYLIGASFRSHVEGSYNKIAYNSRSSADTDHIEGYGNTYKTKKNMKIAVIPIGHSDGFETRNKRDNFNFLENILIFYIY